MVTANTIEELTVKVEEAEDHNYGLTSQNRPSEVKVEITEADTQFEVISNINGSEDMFSFTLGNEDIKIEDQVLGETQSEGLLMALSSNRLIFKSFRN